MFYLMSHFCFIRSTGLATLLQDFSRDRRPCAMHPLAEESKNAHTHLLILIAGGEKQGKGNIHS
jgi:hypothetical protein